MPDPDKPAREINLDRPGAEVTKFYRRVPQNRAVKTVQEAIIAYDQDRPVGRWFSEDTITVPRAAEHIKPK